MSRIRQLDALVINRIAAGEVIERPASVVKELMENSVDALSTRIAVDVAEGGAELIRITDDGKGIHPDDMLLAVSSHATSKLASSDDLFAVRTMGFRGEALASIASVSRMRIRSRQEDSDTGLELEIDGGEVGQPTPCGAPLGTQIEVRSLFLNTPVRRKFLKTKATEFGHISEQFTRIAVSHPNLHLTLKHNNKSVFELPATHDLRERLRMFYGSELTGQLIPVESEAGEIRLWGYVAHPSQSKSTRKGQYLFLNGRWIQDRSLQHALGEAYRGLLMVGRHPIAFLFLELPPDQVDVNVHPSKVEVRFRDAQQLYRQLLSTLRTKFLGMDLPGTMKLPGNAGGESRAKPVDPGEQQQLRMDLAHWARDALSDQAAHLKSGGDLPPATISSFTPPRDTDFDLAAEQDRNGSTDDGWSLPVGLPTPGATAAVASPVMPGLNRAKESETEEPQPQHSTDDERAGENALNQAIPSIPVSPNRAIQVHDCYLVLETNDGLTVIDQHALHERIMYEHLRKRVLAGNVESQKLLVPEIVELGPDEHALLLDHLELMSQLGFQLEEFGGGTLLLQSYPVLIPRGNLSELVRDVAEQLAVPGKSPERRDILDRLLHMMACKAAIKAGQRLTPEEIDSLLQQRHLVDDAHHCPHGRPTALVLSRNELDRQFGRLG